MPVNNTNLNKNTNANRISAASITVPQGTDPGRQPIDASLITVASNQTDDRLIAASYWTEYGWKVLPSDPKTKKVYASAEEKQSGFTHEAFKEHLDQFPKHHPAIVLDEKLIAIASSGNDYSQKLSSFVQGLRLSVAPCCWLVDKNREMIFYRLPDGNSLPATVKLADGIKLLREGEVLLLPQGEFLNQKNLRLSEVPQLSAKDLDAFRVPKPTVNEAPPTSKETQLSKYSLKGFANTLEQQAEAATPILGQLALKGHATAFYASPNTGNPKTLKPYSDIKKAWQEARKLADLEDVHLHDLRHSFASMALNSGAGIDLYTVGKILGHQSIASTERYSHLANDTLMAAAEAGAAKLDVNWSN
ncbi:site-specific integrase [Parasphingorhabdus sp.]|uniref:site-specific integrase n=1 Tax=Parasphingorhabdus sp. TaxID=2709688 RepID=UPI0030019C50